MSARVLRLHPDDPVVLARVQLAAGTHLGAAEVGGVAEVVVTDDIAQGHKVAVVDLASGALVRKYGQPIGVTSGPVRAGQHVHVHNLVSLAHLGAATAPWRAAAAGTAADGSAAVGTAAVGSASVPAGLAIPPDRVTPTFRGYLRPDGRVGTRNYLAVMSSVNCSATAVKRIAAAFAAPGALAPFPGVDGVVALTHSGGCGVAAEGEGFDLLRRTLGGYARHANVVGVLVVGLGCEVNQVPALVESMAVPASTALATLIIQDEGGTRATIDRGVAQVRQMLSELVLPERLELGAGHLVLGLNCGGSDAWSGVSANPVLGVASDLVVAAGGTAVLGETPEIHGAEHLLTARAGDPAVAARLQERLAWWERYAAASGATLDNNPSPGNRAGGISTIEEKSLGAVAKGGTSPLADVVGYAEAVRAKGLVFMDTPGYDPVSVTGIVAGGATVVCFTTGRGSVFGCKPVPSLKLSTTTELYRRMPDDIDFNCGTVLDGDDSVEELGARLFQRILDVASGAATKSEELGMGDEEFTALLASEWVVLAAGGPDSVAGLGCGGGGSWLGDAHGLGPTFGASYSS
jgi:altronate hydrolase